MHATFNTSSVIYNEESKNQEGVGGQRPIGLFPKIASILGDTGTPNDEKEDHERDDDDLLSLPSHDDHLRHHLLQAFLLRGSFECEPDDHFSDDNHLHQQDEGLATHLRHPKRATKFSKKCTKSVPNLSKKCPKSVQQVPHKCPTSVPKVPKKCPKSVLKMVQI